MKSLEMWNAERRQYWADKARQVQHPEEFQNGFECPDCKGALYDTGQMLPSSPTQLRVKCQNCHFRGWRYE